MNRNIILIIILLIIAGTAYFVYKGRKDPATTLERAESNFKIADTETIGRILITNKEGVRSDLKRVGDKWIINDQYRVRQTNIDYLLKGINRQNLDHIPTKGATEDILKSMAVTGIHVEIFDLNGQKMLGYYVGRVTPDERGTFFLKEGSAQPYCLTDPSFDGSLRTRYELRPIDWRDVRFWIEENEKIDTLKVHYPKERQHSFVIYKTGNSYDIQPLFATTARKENPNTVRIESYYTSLSKLACESFVSDSPRRDSIIQSVPFMEMSMIYPDKKSYLHFFFAQNYADPKSSTEIPKYFLNYSGKDFMVAQHDVVKEAFRSYEYFFK